MTHIDVHHESGDRFRISVGGHDVIVDQPGNGDAGPTPTELWVASLAACAGFYARRFLARHGVADGELSVSCDFTWAPDHSRVESIAVRIDTPNGVPHELLPALERVLDHCTVHESLRITPAISFKISSPVPAGVPA